MFIYSTFLIKLVFITVVFTVFTTYIAASEHIDPLLKYDKVLSRYVTDDGLVNYKGIKDDNDFPEIVKYFNETDPDTLQTDNDRLAFWINAYNVFVISGVIEAYPVESVLKIGTIPHSFFRLKRFKTRHGKITLTTLENKKIRESFSDPRIHFAINCASAGCPKLISKAYMGEILDQQLEERTVAFINNKNKNYLDREKRILYLSRIFKWYEGDFTKEHASLENYITKYLNKDNADFLTENSVKIEFLEYDWNLNDIIPDT